MSLDLMIKTPATLVSRFRQLDDKTSYGLASQTSDPPTSGDLSQGENMADISKRLPCSASPRLFKGPAWRRESVGVVPSYGQSHDRSGHPPQTAVVAEVPVEDRGLPMLFHGRAKAIQDVTVQASMTHRFVDPAVAIRRLDFAVDPSTGKWQGTPLEQIGMLVTELAQQHALTLIATRRACGCAG
jgi:hypothetical protein